MTSTGGVSAENLRPALSLTQCRLCGKQFKMPMSLSHHLNIHGLDWKLYWNMYLHNVNGLICKMCNILHSDVYSLESHLKMAHCMPHGADQTSQPGAAESRGIPALPPCSSVSARAAGGESVPPGGERLLTPGATAAGLPGVSVDRPVPSRGLAASAATPAVIAAVVHGSRVTSGQPHGPQHDRDSAAAEKPTAVVSPYEPRPGGGLRASNSTPPPSAKRHTEPSSGPSQSASGPPQCAPGPFESSPGPPQLTPEPPHQTPEPSQSAPGPSHFVSGPPQLAPEPLQSATERAGAPNVLAASGVVGWRGATEPAGHPPLPSAASCWDPVYRPGTLARLSGAGQRQHEPEVRQLSAGQLTRLVDRSRLMVGDYELLARDSSGNTVPTHRLLTEASRAGGRHGSARVRQAASAAPPSAAPPSAAATASGHYSHSTTPATQSMHAGIPTGQPGSGRGPAAQYFTSMTHTAQPSTGWTHPAHLGSDMRPVAQFGFVGEPSPDNCSGMGTALQSGSYSGHTAQSSFAEVAATQPGLMVGAHATESIAEMIPTTHRDTGWVHTSQPASNSKPAAHADTSRLTTAQSGTGRAWSSRSGSNRGLTAEPGSGRGRTAQPGSGRGRAAQPGSDRGRAAKPGSGRGRAAQPGSGRGRAAQPGSGRGRAAQPGSGRGRAAQPVSRRGRAAQPGSRRGNIKQPASNRGRVGQDASGTAQPGPGETTSAQPGSLIGSSAPPVSTSLSVPWSRDVKREPANVVASDRQWGGGPAAAQSWSDSAVKTELRAAAAPAHHSHDVVVKTDPVSPELGRVKSELPGSSRPPAGVMPEPLAGVKPEPPEPLGGVKPEPRRSSVEVYEEQPAPAEFGCGWSDDDDDDRLPAGVSLVNIDSLLERGGADADAAWADQDTAVLPAPGDTQPAAARRRKRRARYSSKKKKKRAIYRKPEGFGDGEISPGNLVEVLFLNQDEPGESYDALDAMVMKVDTTQRPTRYYVHFKDMPQRCDRWVLRPDISRVYRTQLQLIQSTEDVLEDTLTALAAAGGKTPPEDGIQLVGQSAPLERWTAEAVPHAKRPAPATPPAGEAVKPAKRPRASHSPSGEPVQLSEQPPAPLASGDAVQPARQATHSNSPAEEAIQPAKIPTASQAPAMEEVRSEARSTPVSLHTPVQTRPKSRRPGPLCSRRSTVPRQPSVKSVAVAEVGQVVQVVYEVTPDGAQLLCPAKVVEVNTAMPYRRYLVRYLGWKRRFNEWTTDVVLHSVPDRVQLDMGGQLLRRHVLTPVSWRDPEKVAAYSRLRPCSVDLSLHNVFFLWVLRRMPHIIDDRRIMTLKTSVRPRMLDDLGSLTMR